MKTIPRVALLIESSRIYGRGILRGIARYAHVNGAWSIFSQERELHSGIPDWLKIWRGDGIIARIENRRMAKELLRLKIPVVDVLGNEEHEYIPGFDTQAQVVAAMAADFFIKAGFHEIAFCGYRGIPFSDRREVALAAYLAQLGRQLLVCSPKLSQYPPKHIQATEQSGVTMEKTIANWLRKQRRPLALFACNDVRAQQVLNACRGQGIKVPEEVAVMGVDNDDVLCNLSEPSLTSIQPDTERIGYEAAGLLDSMMKGRPGRPGIQQIPPLAIVERSSTDVVPVDDPIIVNALRFIRAQLHKGIGVKDVLEEVGRSRTDLENRFHQHLKISIRGEILRQRMDRACSLLRQTDLRIEDVSARSGFSTSAHLCRLFQRQFKTTPTAYRHAKSNEDFGAFS
jgi:LacI family transcriptional regulator